jgi:hypothetical protein
VEKEKDRLTPEGEFDSVLNNARTGTAELIPEDILKKCIAE